MIIPYFLHKGGIAPYRKHPDDAGYDLSTPSPVVVYPFDSTTVDMKISLAIPKGFYGKITHRSSSNIKSDIVCPDGIIDSGYRGSILVKLYNLGPFVRRFSAGDRIVQIILKECKPVSYWEVSNIEDLGTTVRGEGGIGSTGQGAC